MMREELYKMLVKLRGSAECLHCNRKMTLSINEIDGIDLEDARVSTGMESTYVKMVECYLSCAPCQNIYVFATITVSEDEIEGEGDV